MATRTMVELVDDLDDEPMRVDDAFTVRWAWRGVRYEIDISGENLDRVEGGEVPVSALLARSRRVGGRRDARVARAPELEPVDAKAIREWAARNDYSVGARGRISRELRQAYQESQKTAVSASPRRERKTARAR